MTHRRDGAGLPASPYTALSASARQPHGSLYAPRPIMTPSMPPPLWDPSGPYGPSTAAAAAAGSEAGRSGRAEGTAGWRARMAARAWWQSNRPPLRENCTAGEEREGGRVGMKGPGEP